MRIVRFLHPDGRERWGTGRDDGNVECLEGGLFGEIERTGEVVSVARTLAPVVPVNIFGVGLNYRQHAEETGAELPRYPVLFMKPTTAVAHPGDPIPLPRCCTRGPEVDFEAELAVIIGHQAKDVEPDEALDYVYGYTAANDVSARKWQMHAGARQWVRGKGFDGFCPLGPALVTADEVPDPQALSIGCTVNGVPMQQANTSDMIFSVAEIVSFLSRDTTLLPGTVILTGTPWGVGFARKPPVYLAPGDEVCVEIETIGRLSNYVGRA